MDEVRSNNNRVIEAIRNAYKKMLERKSRLGELVYTDDGTGVMRTQKAIDVYMRLYGELPPLTYHDDQGLNGET